MCFDDALCFGECRYACCRTAIARAPNSYVNESLPLPRVSFRHSFRNPKENHHDEDLNIPPKIKTSIEAHMSEEDKKQFDAYYHYFYWLEFLRSDQPWWENRYEQFYKTIIWYFLGIIYEILFAFPIFILASIFYILLLISILFKFCLNSLYLYNFVTSTTYNMHLCVLTKTSSTFDDLVFNAYRGPTYIISGTFQLFWHMARYHAGAFRVNLMPDAAILSAMLTGPSARDVTILFDDGTELIANGDTAHTDLKDIEQQTGDNSTENIQQLVISAHSQSDTEILQEIETELKIDANIVESEIFDKNRSNSPSVKFEIHEEIKQKVRSLVKAHRSIAEHPFLLRLIDEDDVDIEAQLDHDPIRGDNSDIYTSMNNAHTLRKLKNERTKPISKVIGYRMDFASIPAPAAQHITLVDGNYLRALSMEYKLKPGTHDVFDMSIEIYDSDGILHTVKRPEFNEENFDKKLQLWEAAKAHVQCILCWYPPAWSHNWVHFHLLDVVASRSPLTVSTKTVLGTLIMAHLKYVSAINTAGIGNSLSNPQSEDDCIRRMFPWKGQPVTPGQFASTIAQNTRYHYLHLNKEGLIKEGKEVFPPYWVIVRRYYGKDDPHNHPQSTQFRGIIPALDFLSDYYYAIQTFVKKLWGIPVLKGNQSPSPTTPEQGPIQSRSRSPTVVHNGKSKRLRASLLEHDIYKQWLTDLQSNGLPGLLLPIRNRVDVISTIIWTSAIVHCSDHISYGNIYAKWPMYSSYVDFHVNQHWKDVLWNNDRAQKGAYISREVIDWFVSYRYSMWKYFTQDMLTSPKLYNNFDHIAHRSKIPQLRKIHDEFLKDLAKLNERWGWFLDNKTLAASTCY